MRRPEFAGGLEASWVPLLVAAAVLTGCGGGPASDAPGAGALQVGEILGDTTAGFAVADKPRSFVFPADHGAHPDFRSEWWYVTGNVTGADGQPFGFQITFFRTALAPAPPQRPSRWATRQLYMAHLAVTAPESGRFRAHERFARGALGLAGAHAAPFRVWLEGWQLAAVDPGQDGPFPARIRAAAGDDALDLVLEPLKPLVLQGDAGLSRKGAGAANASYYYSYSRLRASGTLRAGGRDRQVEGTAWLDREWSTSALEADQVGWDWFALQLDDGRELMLYRMRRADGAADPHTSGTLVEADGSAVRLGPEDLTIAVLDHWRSPHSGIRYPSRWRLAVPARGLALRVEPLMTDQELDLTFRYWEGAVRVTGDGGDAAPVGKGYVELTGYERESGSPAPSQKSERSNR